MLIPPNEIMTLLAPFQQVVGRRIWDLAEVLVVGAILAPGKRTVTAVLQVMGLKDERLFQNYHRVLNRAKWSGLAASGVLLRLLVYGVTYISRPRFDAALHRPTRRQGAKKGRRLPSLRQCLTDAATVWATYRVPWYAGREQTVELATGTALWCTPGRDPLPIR